jgi:hypothetical protein
VTIEDKSLVHQAGWAAGLKFVDPDQEPFR